MCRDWLRLCGARPDLQPCVEGKQLAWLIEQEQEEEAEQACDTLALFALCWFLSREIYWMEQEYIN